MARKFIASALLAIQLTKLAFATQNCDNRLCINPGISVDADHCDNDQIYKLADAAEHILPIVKAARRDVQTRKANGLFDSFFRRADRATVARGLHNLQEILEKKTSSLYFSCNDPEGWSASHGSIAVNGMYEVPQHNQIPSITNVWFLEKYWPLKPMFETCDSISKTLVDWDDHVTVMLHELLHTRYLAGQGIELLQDLSDQSNTMDAAMEVRKGLHPELKPIESVLNWIWYIRFAFTLNQQQMNCPDAFPLWNYFSPNEDFDSAKYDAELRNELRRLHQVSEDEDGSSIEFLTETRILEYHGSKINSTVNIDDMNSTIASGE